MTVPAIIREVFKVKNLSGTNLLLFLHTSTSFSPFLRSLLKKEEVERAESPRSFHEQNGNEEEVRPFQKHLLRSLLKETERQTSRESFPPSCPLREV